MDKILIEIRMDSAGAPVNYWVSRHYCEWNPKELLELVNSLPLRTQGGHRLARSDDCLTYGITSGSFFIGRISIV